jgi:hypothetical protein
MHALTLVISFSTWSNIFHSYVITEVVTAMRILQWAKWKSITDIRSKLLRYNDE